MTRNKIAALAMMCASFSVSAQQSANIAIFNADTNQKIADFNGSSAEIPYADNLELRIQNNVDYDWYRILPEGSDCGESRAYGSSMPLTYTLAPANDSSVCSFQVDAMQRGPVVNASTTFTLSFGGGSATPTPTPTPTPDGDRIDYAQGTLESRPYYDAGYVGRNRHGNRI